MKTTHIHSVISFVLIQKLVRCLLAISRTCLKISTEIETFQLSLFPQRDKKNEIMFYCIIITGKRKYVVCAVLRRTLKKIVYHRLAFDKRT